MDDRQIDQLAAAFQDGDTGSFRMLVESQSRALLAMGFRYTRDSEAARDLTQETWMAVHDSIDSYDRTRAFATWLRAIHRNKCLSYLRKPAVRHEQAYSHEELRRVAPALATPNPYEYVAQADFMQRLHRALAMLSNSQRHVFALVELEEMRPNEAARFLDMNPTTLRTTLHFARRRLAKLLRETEKP